MKNSSLNNLLSFLVTAILIFMLAFILMVSYLENYKKSREMLNDISEIRESMFDEIDDILGEQTIQEGDD